MINLIFLICILEFVLQVLLIQVVTCIGALTEQSFSIKKYLQTIQIVLGH